MKINWDYFSKYLKIWGKFAKIFEVIRKKFWNLNRIFRNFKKPSLKILQKFSETLSWEILMKFQGSYENFVNVTKINRTILENTWKYEKNLKNFGIIYIKF